MADEHIRQAASNGQLPAIPADHADAAQPTGENPFRIPRTVLPETSANDLLCWRLDLALTVLVLLVIMAAGLVAIGMVGEQTSTTFSTICNCIDTRPPAPPEDYIPEDYGRNRSPAISNRLRNR